MEYANLRAGFRWAADHQDLETATSIAAHTTLLAWVLQRYESVGWAEELLNAATSANVPELPRLYTAASFYAFTGRPEACIGFAQTAVALDADPRYDGFQPGWSRSGKLWVTPMPVGSTALLAIFADVAAQPGSFRILILGSSMWLLTGIGRDEEARMIADETLAAARAHGNPFYIAIALANGREALSLRPTRTGP